MPRPSDLLLTALAPVVWGSTYAVTSLLLPPALPLTTAMLRALPAGLLLVALTHSLPPGRGWYGRILVLGALNFSIFWVLLFVAAYRLPGGVAATLGAIMPLLVAVLEAVILKLALRPLTLVAGGMSLAGVAMMVLTGTTTLDPLGVAAGLGGAMSMALGMVLTRLWQPPASALVFTAWQLVAGGLLLLPVALLFETLPPDLSGRNLAGFLWLGLAGAALSYWVWFRGLARLRPSQVALLGGLSPMTAVLLGWALLGQALTPWQMAGFVLVGGALWLNQRARGA